MDNQGLTLSCSPNFPQWLTERLLSLAFTTYQTNRLCFIGSGIDGRLKVHERLLDKPMGLYGDTGRLYLSTRYQIWEFQNILVSDVAQNEIIVSGLSQLRSQTFTGLGLEKRLMEMGDSPRCGLMVIDLKTGKPVHWLYFETMIEELFDVVVLPGVRQAQAIGLQGDEIQRLVTFPDSGNASFNYTLGDASLTGTAAVTVAVGANITGGNGNSDDNLVGTSGNDNIDGGICRELMPM
ncbi:DUF4915 domain-containing protein [Crocosphaera sp. UHCC 0190]|uniref:DUF4915 domain-containing protein n=1 Tax=Crocosphaera sp. UHCC 0190 TaxID=3110246 RepID=UPI002B220E2E|nr:DUF4915 domain-containing protein [Crocosphaera sp. UHCC 0190]MEA5509840.1 DUF4915 domain-containing protein [Crocosphaera sp. UHCC 0190]